MLGLPVEYCELGRKCAVHASGCGHRAFGAPIKLFFVMERDILARVVPPKTSSVGPTSSIPHGSTLLCEDCLLCLELFSSQRVHHPVCWYAEIWSLGAFDCTQSSAY